MKTKLYYWSLVAISLLQGSLSFAQNSKKWTLLKGNKIEWKVRAGENHEDHIEMAGLQTAAVVYYGVRNGRLLLDKKIVFPMLRTIPNNTHASLTVPFQDNKSLLIKVDGVGVDEYPLSFGLDGKLSVYSKTNSPLEIQRTLFPAVDKPVLIEQVKLVNTGSKPLQIDLINKYSKFYSDPEKSVYGQYVVQALLRDSLVPKLEPLQSYQFNIVYEGKKITEPAYQYSPSYELGKREDFVKGLAGDLILETPNDTINTAFAFAKIRATESIYDTKGGLMHGPGGLSYYAAIWANDQAEYANPFFPFLGNRNGNESAINSFRHFARFMNSDYKPIPSSIVAEGDSYWNGAKDRGDMAMIAYGASRYALALGKKDIATELWPLIHWCFEYLERQKTDEGVYRSDSDELEGRAPAGKINLSTNSIAYGAYRSAADLARELGKDDLSKLYLQRAGELRSAIVRYFGTDVQGYSTYRYYDGNSILRAWICLPMTMGITERSAGTIDALLSKYLWTNNGILTQSGDKVFWDRATLYAFKGFFMTGATERALPYFKYYSSMRLLGDHVPYPVEAWPEGGQRHLSAESALYCRVITEGLFHIVPTGFRKFSINPSLPKEWKYMRLRRIRAFDRVFDLEVVRRGKQEFLVVKQQDGTIIQKIILKNQAISITLN
ncbi:hypothetical protein [Sphingobacterium detergens]|uniref:Alpha-L-rhamnosidase six-hairpin glycosidase domain-containing protein n=1 Tax=Sphingobacterium detergens TaxID=1145106 RepID=A0A420BJJ7_SPHD1|nr:hypothetical protein [Sphingobacterium detergens]RKE56951.1 hypothetical protein DFQ12_1825 [Sphingobacterium detergens]